MGGLHLLDRVDEDDGDQELSPVRHILVDRVL